MNDCDSCKRACGFKNTDWYPPSAIVYCRPQVLWYLEHCDYVREGNWPPQPDGSSYTDPSVRSDAVKIPSKQAEQLAAEMDYRIKRCGIEGKLLEYEVKLEYELSPTSLKVLNYCSGWRRRGESYRQFKSRRKS